MRQLTTWFVRWVFLASVAGIAAAAIVLLGPGVVPDERATEPQPGRGTGPSVVQAIAALGDCPADAVDEAY